MDIILGIFFFFLGATVGSFVNVVSLRYHTGRSIVTGRSACFSCAESVPWYDLVPILSYFALRGKCRACGSALSLQYPAVEILTGTIFLGIFFKFFLSLGLSYPSIIHYPLFILVIGLLMVILVYDIRHKIVPNAFVYPLIGISFLYTFDSVSPIFFSLNHLGAGIGFALPIAALWLFSKGRAMGLGDAKLALALGFLLGPTGALSAFLLSFWIGAGVGVALLTMKPLFKAAGRFTMKSELPFAPFLILGFLLVFFFNVNALEIFL